MNAAAKALSMEVFTPENVLAKCRHVSSLVIFGLVMVVLFSAFSVVYEKDFSRRLFSELQILQQQRDQLRIEWGQLLLEQSTTATQTRVQRIAQQKLEMVYPSSEMIRTVQN